MKSYRAIAIVVSVCSIACVTAFAQAGGASSAAKPAQSAASAPTIASVLDRQLSGIERNIMGDVMGIRATTNRGGGEPIGSGPGTEGAPGDVSWEARFQRDSVGLEMERTLPSRRESETASHESARVPNSSRCRDDLRGG